MFVITIGHGYGLHLHNSIVKEVQAIETDYVSLDIYERKAFEC